MSLRHFSTFKGPSAGRTTDKFQQQTRQKDVKFSLAGSVQCIKRQPHDLIINMCISWFFM